MTEHETGPRGRFLLCAGGGGRQFGRQLNDHAALRTGSLDWHVRHAAAEDDVAATGRVELVEPLLAADEPRVTANVVELRASVHEASIGHVGKVGIPSRTHRHLPDAGRLYFRGSDTETRKRR